MIRRVLKSSIAAATLIAALSSGGTAWGDAVTVRGSDQGDFIRLVFDWPAPVAFSAAVEGDLLSVTFGRQIEASYDGALQSLGRHMTGAETGGGGRAALFRLRGRYDAIAFDQGASVVVDLIPLETPLVAAPSRGATPPADATTQETPFRPIIEVRSGEHKDFSRLVFDWPEPVRYTLQSNGRQATIRFESPADADLGAMRSRPPKNLQAIAARGDDQGLTVTLTLPEGGRVKHYRSDGKVVVDVMRALQSPEPPKVAEVSVAPAAPVANPRPEAPKAAAPVKLDPPKDAGGGPPPPVAQPTAPVSQPTPLETAKPEVSATQQGKPTPLTPNSEASGAKAPQQVSSAPPVQGNTEASSPPPAADVQFSLSFKWEEPVAAAVFRRAGYLWLVFDKHTTPDTEALRLASQGGLESIEQVPSDRSTALRMKLPEDINPIPRRNGLEWNFDFAKQPLSPEVAIETMAQSSAVSGDRLFLPVPEAGFAVPVRDPSVGDNLVVVPVIPLRHGVAANRQYPEFEVLPSAQGVVLRPRIDDLRVRPFRQGVELTSASNLKVTSLNPNLEAAAQVAAAQTLRRVFDLDAWSLGSLDDFTENKQRLQYDVSMTTEKARTDARMALARFFLAYGLGPEALAVLSQTVKDDKDIAKEAKFLSLRGASNFMMHRYDEAATDFSDQSLQRIDEAALWLAATQAAQGDAENSAPILRRTGSLIRSYPRPLKSRVGIEIVSAALSIGDLQQAEHYLEMLRVQEPSAHEKAQLDFLEGRIAEIAGDFDTAVAKWEEAMAGPHRPVRAKAAFAREELLRKLEKINKREAIEELEKLRFAWRGDSFEFNLLRTLGNLYFEENDFRSGLRALRQAATYFRKDPAAPEVTQTMSKVFNDLYLEGKADAMPPVTAIALFDEFKELTPAGEEGDRMIRHLADRLIDVDLLDRAAELLQNQVEFRLKGVERARVGAKLALIKMFDKKIEQGIKSLDDTEASGLPDDLATIRRHLRARALIALERNDDALAVLKGDESLDANKLRVSMYWQAKEWGKAAESLRQIVRDGGARAGKPLEDKQARSILDLAVALTLAGNERGMERVRRDFEAGMEQSDYKDAFRLISSETSRGLIDYRTLESRVSEAETFTNFLADYKAKLKAGQIDALK
ncbi:MAG: hypothetical protein OQJ87_09320 [Rhodospirillales bacterium]|nr:hypothetical protein [Rhodospirillales bacterium]MCW8951898.1 hypothetical protein [Rhodospirillales bacterium]MCW9002904.1 hypothetical protein [Rhodospirillales bacterium]